MSVATVKPHLACKHCGRVTLMSESDARVLGWRTWRGKTLGGRDAEDVVCPQCAGTTPADEPAPSWRVGCDSCGWEWEDEDDEGPLSEKDAQQMADDHECE